MRINSARLILILVLTLPASSAMAQSGSERWFGLELPPGIGDPHSATVAVASANPAAADVPQGEAGYQSLAGESLFMLVDYIVDFSRASRAEGNRIWGRITGFPSAARTVDWVAEQFSDAGLVEVQVQEYQADASMWWASDWEVRLLGKPSFGPGSRDVVLETSLPTGGSFIAGEITAPLIDVGHIDDPVPVIDVTGKVAVQRMTPVGGAYSERTATRERAQALIANGALAVINIVEQLGNMHTRDFSNCNGPCFNLGTADGEFLLAAMSRATGQGLGDQLEVALSLDAKELVGLTGHNAIGIVPGRNGLQGENIIVNAHVDGWYDGAGDNADGLAVLIGMARHFAQHPAERTLVFVASGGHHSSGLNGPRNAVRQNSDLMSNSILALNLEHIAQLRIDSSDWSVGPEEQPMNFGISNESDYVARIARTGMARYGFNLNPDFSDRTPGDLGGYRSLGIAMVQAIHSGPMYHASGDVRDTISIPGLERAARFYTYFIDQIAQASLEQIDPD